MRIEDGSKLDYKNVLIRPRLSTLGKLSLVDIPAIRRHYVQESGPLADIPDGL